MKALGEYEALSFDCYGTLIDWEAGIAAELRPWAAGHRVDLAAGPLVDLFSRHESAVQAAHPSMLYPDVLGATLALVADDLSITASSDEMARFGGSVERWPAFADSVEALARLKQRYVLVILSNIDAASFAASNARLEVEFDLIVTAEDVGSYKPDPRNFDALRVALSKIDIDESGLLHVAQSLYHDHEPAKRAGLPTVFIDRRHDQAGFGATPPPSDAGVKPDWTFPSMAAFADAATKSA